MSSPKIDGKERIKTPVPKAKPQYIPFTASRANLACNVVINALFGVGLFLLYKDYRLNQAARKQEKAQARGTVTIVNDRESQMWKPHGREPGGVLSGLSYGELSFFTIGLGFLIQLANMARVSFGKKSLLYRAGVASVVLYPPFTISMYGLRSRRMLRVRDRTY
ncbi:LAMI_0G13344g1_1 [Lachancea mirantina]|uniref:LAMI_0G13344g1_1 n=1 Tax=Lachancea mirantina TaxID=1230905 RepID=A0A1G4KBT7_9SACH|nr:LAMI_0G13344g1_1 [Lachancea mirantina]